MYNVHEGNNRIIAGSYREVIDAFPPVIYDKKSH